jgi:hypothetical protein
VLVVPKEKFAGVQLCGQNYCSSQRQLHFYGLELIIQLFQLQDPNHKWMALKGSLMICECSLYTSKNDVDIDFREIPRV